MVISGCWFPGNTNIVIMYNFIQLLTHVHAHTTFLLYRIKRQRWANLEKKTSWKLYVQHESSDIQEQLFLVAGLSFYILAFGRGKKNINTVWKLGVFLCSFFDKQRYETTEIYRRKDVIEVHTHLYS